MLAPRDEAKSIRKKTPLSAPLEQVMKEVAPDASNTSGSFARVERRIVMLEKAFADIVERHEKSLRERVGVVSAIEENLLGLRNRLDQSEKRHTGAMTELRSALANACMRLNGVEAAQSPAPPQVSAVPFPDPLPVRVDMIEETGEEPTEISFAPAFAEVSDLPQDENPSEGEPPTRPETYLSAARRAANASISPPEASSRAQQPRSANRTKFLLLGCAAPMVIVAAFVFVLNRHVVTAETVTVPIAAATPARVQPTPAPVQTAQRAAPEATIAPSGPPQPASTLSIGELEEKAKGGDPKAERDLGLRYLAGNGLTASDAEAARWLLSAAYKGEPTAEYWLGTLYAKGHGVPADAFQATHWYEAGAKQGNLRAMHSLAVANFQGWGREKNPAEAAKWFEKAAQLGSVDSQYNLAVLHEQGTGVPKSLSDAYRWYAIAAAAGDKESQARVAILAKQLSPADLQAAMRAAAAFKPDRADESANAATNVPSVSGG